MEVNNKKSFITNSEAREALLAWYYELNNARGDRAELRRCHTVMEVAFNPAFHRLRLNLNQFNPESLALVSGVLAHVKNNDTSKHFAAQMATPKHGNVNARVSELRFRRLLKIQDQSELFGAMIRIVRLLDGNVNIPSLATGLYWWNELTRKDWAYAYYDTGLKET